MAMAVSDECRVGPLKPGCRRFMALGRGIRLAASRLSLIDECDWYYLRSFPLIGGINRELYNRRCLRENLTDDVITHKMNNQVFPHDLSRYFGIGDNRTGCSIALPKI